MNTTCNPKNDVNAYASATTHLVFQMSVCHRAGGYITPHDAGGGGCDGQRTKVPILYLGEMK